jgi:hypothetical protein
MMQAQGIVLLEKKPGVISMTANISFGRVPIASSLRSDDARARAMEIRK